MRREEVSRWAASLARARVTRWGGMISTPDDVLQVRVYETRGGVALGGVARARARHALGRHDLHARRRAAGACVCMRREEVSRWAASLARARVTRWGGMISTPDDVLQVRVYETRGGVALGGVARTRARHALGRHDLHARRRAAGACV
ncbi:hypothetical protein MSG28_007398 [Choristoneura fumiferana]|uniref:Uncharacterized protein n=1 Tax=Choristoneura fumiferana TaxID=7141 RepID=A0ACC0JWT4_CHOFU|nr:hypothetical protein MSG28_007398 [Choristoneura fumiferana]